MFYGYRIYIKSDETTIITSKQKKTIKRKTWGESWYKKLRTSLVIWEAWGKVTYLLTGFSILSNSYRYADDLDLIVTTWCWRYFHWIIMISRNKSCTDTKILLLHPKYIKETETYCIIVVEITLSVYFEI